MSQAAFEPQVICVKKQCMLHPPGPFSGNLNSIFHGFVWFHRATGVQIAMQCGRCYLHSVQIITPYFSRFLAESLFDITKVHVSWERSSAARLSWKDVNVRVCMCVCMYVKDKYRKQNAWKEDVTEKKRRIQTRENEQCWEEQKERRKVKKEMLIGSWKRAIAPWCVRNRWSAAEEWKKRKRLGMMCPSHHFKLKETIKPPFHLLEKATVVLFTL